MQALQEVAVEFGCPNCWPDLRAYAAAREGWTAEAIRLYEAVREAPFVDTRLAGTWGTQAMILLGPPYEEAGDTARAVEAYERVVREWANADARGMERVRQAEARIEALSFHAVSGDREQAMERMSVAIDRGYRDPLRIPGPTFGD